MLDIEILPAAAVTVLRFDGELTATGTAAVRAATNRLRQAGRLVVDLGGVRKVDRPGLAALVGLLMKAKAKGGAVGVRCASPTVVDLLHREGIDRLFPLQPATISR